MKKIGIIAKSTHTQAKELVRSITELLLSKKLDIVVDQETLYLLEKKEVSVQARSDITNICDLIIVLGGDGTLISVCRHPSKKSPKIIGVNLGTLGFLTEITITELTDAIENAIAGKSVLEKRSLLSAEIFLKGKEKKQTYALNDVVISKETIARIFPTKVSVDGKLAAIMRGDGVIVASPSGSTAYSLAAGGSIVHPRVDAILITPICPHSLTSRPLVIPGNSMVELEIEPGAEQFASYLTVDGQEGYSLSSGDKVKITTSEFYVLFAKSCSRTYFDVLGTKLKWASS